MNTSEQNVRAAAHALQEAIFTAQADGFAVEWPSSFAALTISETGKVSSAAAETQVAESAEPAPVAKSKK
jgi:hypothetical protein